MRALVLVLPALLLAAGPCLAQNADDVRISGRVEKFERGLISVSPSQGIVLTIRFDAKPGINSMRRAKPADLKAGMQVAVEAKTNPTGGLMASQVIIYEHGAERAAGAAASTEPSDVVARLSAVTQSADGAQLTLAYKEGERKIALAKESVVWIARPASAEDIKPGALITLSGTKPVDGEIHVIKASVGPAGGDNPPL